MKKISVFCLVFLASSSLAQRGSDWITVEPIYGLERVQKLFPRPARMKTRSFLGVRAVAGPRLISAEAEVTLAKDTEEFPEQNLTVKEETHRAKLGLRSTLTLGRFLGFYFRSGMQIRQDEQTITDNGVSSTRKPGPRWDPYAGAGLQVALGRTLAVSGGATAVFADSIDDADDIEYQYTLGITFRVGSLR